MKIISKHRLIYEREEEEKAHYMDRDDIEQQEAFKYREQLIPSLQNAFLFRKVRNEKEYKG